MPETSSEYDYIIVGAGTAGCVLAARLSENTGHSVCLIEAGGSEKHPYTRIPAAVGAAIMKPEFGWGLMSTPQSALGGRRVPLPRGRMLGGSGSLNGMAYYRGHAADYDDWAATGCKGWSYAELLPYFLRSEANRDYAGSPFHGKDGPMGVSFIKNPNPLCESFNQAMQHEGYAYCDDFNVAEPEGYGYRQASIVDGRRVSTATAYLRPALSRSNLTVLTETATRRIVFEGSRATGVEVQTEAGIGSLKARREIVVCGGAFHSPHILMNSGVGDASALEKAGIQPVHYLSEVGRNLHDHPASFIAMDSPDSTSYGLSLKAAPRDIWNGLQYLLARSGPLASNLFETNAYIRSDEGADRPDMQVVFQPARRNVRPFPLPLGHGYAISIVCLYPRSRGSVTLASSDPLQAPLIDPALGSAPQDIETIVRGLKLARRLFSHSAFGKYRATERLPGSAVDSDAGWQDYVRETLATVHHPGGTCRMGADNQSVVTPELKVRGLEGLRVADASVYPRVPGANTNASVVAIAEKCADLILGIPAPEPLTHLR